MKTIFKFVFSFTLFMSAAFIGSVRAQVGLENIIIEKYYVSNAADSSSAAGALPVGSVTYRVYVDMKPGYNFQALYGVSNHPLTIQTSTSFFNDENYGSTSPNGISQTNIRKFTSMIDSWFSVGASCSGKIGVRKTVDTDGTVGNANGILANTDPSIGFPLTGATGRDGFLAGTPVSVTFVGISNTGNGDLGVIDGTSQVGGLFTTNNGSIAALGGATGLDTTNIVLVGQFTTNGVLQYQLNVQIGTPTGGTENYVSSNPVGSEVTRSFLTGTVGAANQPPTVSITAPTNGASFITGTSISITANAADADGTIASVEFFVDGVSIGVDNTAPYAASYTGVLGTRSLTAIATDNSGAQTTSAAVSITVANNPPPTCSITAPTTGSSFIVGDLISIAATATDNGSVASVEFFVDGVLLSTDNTSPYTATYTGVLGSHTLTARATDNLGAQTVSSAVAITVANNVPPSVSITSPANGANFTFPNTVTFNASASDADGTVSSVGFFVNGTLVGTDNTAPYSFAWTSVIGTATVTAQATDNRGAVTTSTAITVNIIDPNALPYKVVNTNVPCASTSFCLPVRAVDTVRNVIGYDVTLNFNTNKIRPTGNVTVFGNLITSSYVDVANTIDTVNGIMNISLFFNGTAPSTAKFQGTGDVFCVEFNKTANVNAIDTSTVSISFLQESYFTGVASKLVDAGKYITYKDSVLRGNLRFWIDNSPIRYNSANPNQYLLTNIAGANDSCTTTSVATFQPDTTGAFNYIITNGTKLRINKDIPGTTSVQPVVNGFDAFLIRRTLLNDPTFVPSIYQAIAMDVNFDGVISAGDLSQTNQRAVLFIPEFRQAWNYNQAGVSNGQLSKDWIFIDSSTTLRTNLAYRISTTFPFDDGIGFSKSRVPVVPFCLPTSVSSVNSCPNIVGDVYRAVMVGDVNGSYSAVPNAAFRTTANDRLVVETAKSVTRGRFVEVPLSFVAQDAVHAVDFAMLFDESKLRFESVMAESADLQVLAHFNAGDHTLRLTSNSISNLNAFAKVATLRFEMLGGNFDADYLTVTEGYLNGEAVRVDKSISSSLTSTVIYPNPAKDLLNVISSENATLEMVDMAGRLVYRNDQIIAGQRTEINTVEFSSGVYLVRVSNDRNVSTERVIISK